MTDGHKKALELIAENKRTRSPFLDLGNLGLTEVPEEVFECVWLEGLSFGTYKFIAVFEKSYKENKHKYPLEFSMKIAIPKNEDNLLFLKQDSLLLSKSLNKIDTVSEKILHLENLKVLIFDYNNLVKIDFVLKMSSLIFCDFSSNRIDSIKADFFDNRFLLNFEGALRQEFYHNEFVIVGYMSDLTKRNSQKNKRGYQKLPLVIQFPIHDTKLSFRSRAVLLLINNPITSPPIEIIRQGKIGIDAYYGLKSSVKMIHYGHGDNVAGDKYVVYNPHPSPLNQLKTLLVGDGLSGKTSLLKKILDKEFDIGEPQTHGINIHPKDLEIDGESIHVKFWDFGGQEIMHGTHTFFYSKRSIYLLVLDARREGKEDYWLKHIESFGGDSPVLVVLNKIDENPSFDVNRAFLQNKYPNIVGFVRVSCKTGDGIDQLVQELEKQIHALEMRRTPFAKSWFEVKEALDTMGEDYISYDRYYALCREKEVTDETAQNVLLQFLHDLGIVLAFKNLDLLDTQVINPLWLTNAVYRIINSKLVAGKKGYLHLSDLDAILNLGWPEGFKYPRNKFLYIVKIMQEFELCYRIAEDVFIVPDLLTVEEQPVPGFGYDTALRFVLQYDFLPASVLPRFMVQLHTRIVEGEQWRTGAALTDPIFKAKAVVKADRDEKRLYLWVNGPDRDSRRNFFNFIRKTLHDIHDSFEKLTVTELVPVPGHDDIFIEYAELVGYEEMGLADYPVGKLRRKFNVGEMLSGLEAPERRQPRRHAPVKVFVSYSDEDESFRDELVKHLFYFSKMEEIELWHRGLVMAGTERENNIHEKLDEADIVLCLVSADFIASEACSSELEKALQQRKKGEKLIIPIEAKTCAWKQLPEFGELKGLPSKPISAFEPRDDGWGEVFAGMEGAVKRVLEKRSKT